MISDSNKEPRQHYGEGDQKNREGGTESEVSDLSEAGNLTVEFTEGKK